jgi:hypothetical protein
MEFIPDIWAKLADRILEQCEAQVFAPGRRIGFKSKRGELKLPESLVRELMREAYVSGARVALRMAAELDSTKEGG